MAIFRCKMCGGTLEINSETVATCEYCGTQQTLPKLDSEQKINLYDRANHFRRNNDYDKAMSIYENILNTDTTDAEAYWSILLCRFGVEYVEDPVSHKHIPTINRAQFTSVFADEDYKSAVFYASPEQKAIYEQEAAYIDEVQKCILEISNKEEPFDVFICYKETDANGRRTRDSVLATELYHGLVNEGFKVFFSRITLEDKLGQEYEPYIFAALNSVKVMVVMGTKPEHFNAVWVKNEWSRYLSLVKKSNGKKILIPAYKDMDPYDLPEEFSHLQAQDMTKLGFMQDLIYGIKKLVAANEPKTAVKETVVINNENNGNVSALLKRGFMCLEDGEWSKADEFFEQALNQDAELADAYLGKLMADLKVRKMDSLKDCPESFANNKNYQKIMRFGDDDFKDKASNLLDLCLHNIEEREKSSLYMEANDLYENPREAQDFEKAEKLFKKISGYKDSVDKAKECLDKYAETVYQQAIENIENQNYEKAIENLKTIPNWKDSQELIKECEERYDKILIEAVYQQALERIENEDYAEAIEDLKTIPGYKNSEYLIEKYAKKANNIWNKKESKTPLIYAILLLICIGGLIISSLDLF